MPEERVEITFSAILSSPRIGFTSTWHCIHTAIKGVPCASYVGPWWERGIQQHLVNAQKLGTDFVVTFDYDSIFTEQDFDALLQAIVNDDKIDAISSLQMRRGKGHALLTIGAQAQQEIKADSNTPIKVSTAHFGLTIFRVSAFKDIPLPWLWNVPNGGRFITLPNGNEALEMLPTFGGWEDEHEGRLDADIYLWKKFEKYGRSAYVLPGVQIGHIEEVIASPNPLNGKVRHCYLSDYGKAQRNNVDVEPRKEKDEKPQ